jgi:uncharacterized damage-inducible protein DinB
VRFWSCSRLGGNQPGTCWGKLALFSGRLESLSSHSFSGRRCSYTFSVSLTIQLLLNDIGRSAWANHCLLEGCSALTAEELECDLRISHTSILSTLRHIYDGERVWFDCLRTTADLGTWRLPQGPAPQYSLDTLRQSWPELWKGFARWLEEMPETGLEIELNLQLPGGVERRFPRWKILRHVLEHSTMHRGQVVGMIRMLGYQPPPNSPMDYYLASEPAVSA